ncbi:D-tagatose-bisphosphate aldolase, class II, non-catalytic subunit [Cellulomonas sp. NPDC089187]|uniref:D-tagatose-bisphosphate aldolase, class II, non-catalytic subunit n=1 Tax=Cellulomonas sp. NPDC089187 TaxID=3154970 RepID=UPI0034358D71
MRDALREVLARNKAGEGAGIYSVCSAHPLVIEAAALQVLADGGDLLVEATSNQVDQFGGYTGMTPAQFREFVYTITDAAGLDRDRVILGGDHLGPNRWSGQDAATAMDHAEDLVRAYVAAGYTKIHLDCSMSCADDPTPLTDAIVAERAARLMRVAQEAELSDAVPVSYVIGTEVPVPGGAHETLGELTPTSPEAARETIRAHQEAFAAHGVSEAWNQVVAMVVQPGVEFDHVQVVDYRPERTGGLQQVIADQSLVFEAHSTDYQTEERLRALVVDHWAILKVGPGLTFALREALFALAAIEDELLPVADRSGLRAVIEQVMLDDPTYWQSYYEGDPDEQALARKYSYSDRIRYYLPNPRIVAAIDAMFAGLDRVGIPEPLIGQYLPDQFWRVRDGILAPRAKDLAVDRVRDVLRLYSAACAVA